MERWHGPSESAWLTMQENVSFLLLREREMTAQQGDFDQAFSDLSSAVGTLITDFSDLNTKIQNLPPSGPSPAQVQELKDLSGKVQAALPAAPPPAVTDPTAPTGTPPPGAVAPIPAPAPS